MAKVEANDLNKFLLGLEIRRDLKPQDLIGWMPIKIQFRQEGPTVAWLYPQSIDFAQPRFFKQMIETHVLGQSQWEQIVLTPIDMLTTLSNISPGLEPTGFIFHVSRCGSTLLANMLMALPRNLVLIEPNLINKVLMLAGRNVLAITAHDWLRAVISTLGRPCWEPVAQNYFLKFSSWNILHLPLIRSIFPEVPFIIIYRDPVEVMVSQLDCPGGWMRAKKNPDLVAPRVQLPAHDIATMGTEEYCARVLSNFYKAAARYADSHTIVVNYNQLSKSLLCQLLTFVGIKATDAEIEVMMHRTQFYSKDPRQEQVFEDDRGKKQKLVTPIVRMLSDRWVKPQYEKLEAMKTRRMLSSDLFEQFNCPNSQN